ncbi:L-ribulose-5-phosphate 4-epimerase [Clostridium formicaceticum]|uniref:L-ribulose-5-phosphate 4-epimerase n=1 Tax=Clostridium formicaceticum TaxID=1497 RepID=A0AAC9RH98_9CLOT|nr:L-ribulose-5-phosphate 4-epimerase [Clostridium formicaceticum]AOY75716.1 L-ribulose-5-phosphate 4-epimerase [Clostridium formicaceticum]ARE86036.1 L-ribulose-5-phosphate 4-epimerase UlaF [Clostridium formicaceticum]
MLKKLKEQVLQGNLELPKRNLVTYTWGNVSGIDREKGFVVIKPSGVPYEEMTLKDLVVVDLEGNQVEGDMKPSSDTPTHLVLYKAFPDIGGVVHTHSHWSTVWAQIGKGVPALGTTHADYFYGEIPCTRKMTLQEIEGDYEEETGKVIIEGFIDKNPNYFPGVLVKNHGPFSWGKDPQKAVENAVIMEEIAKLAYYTLSFSPDTEAISDGLLDKHFLRKHGKNAYYGQG